MSRFTRRIDRSLFSNIQLNPEKKTRSQNETSQERYAVHVVEDIKEPSVIDKVLDIKLLKHKKYLEVLEEFLKTTYEYNPCCFLEKEDIVNDYNDFINSPLMLEKMKNFNGLFGINLKDIPRIDNRFIQKDIEFCKSCNKKYFKNCCDNYISKHKQSTREGCFRKRCILHISKKITKSSKALL